MTRPIEEWLSQPGGIAERLRNARRRAGLTGAQLAEANGWPPSKVSKLENGRQAPTVADIHAWLSTAGAAADADDLVAMLESLQQQHQSWRRRLRQGQAAAQAGYTDMVRRARLVRDFSMGYFPSMLQTPQYARYPLMKAVKLFGQPESEVEAAVAARMQRQTLLYDADKRFEFLLDEPVLTRLVCPPDVLHAQVDRLHTVLGLPNVRLGILPASGVRMDLTPENSFTIVDGVVLVETVGGENSYAEDDLVRVHEAALDMWWQAAAEGDEARRLIVEAVRQLEADG